MDSFFCNFFVSFFHNLIYYSWYRNCLKGDDRMNTEVLWTKLLQQIKVELSSLAFETWFRETKLYSLIDGKAIITVPMSIHKSHLMDNYGEKIEDILSDICGNHCEIEFLLEDEVKEIELQIKEQEQKKATVQEKSNKINNNLESKYSFDNFIVGNTNKFAQAAALSVAENPGKMYNPLFIYGNSGLGKTHLMHAIGNYIVENSNKRVIYVTSDQFIQDFIGINKRDSTGSNFNFIDFFKDKYRNIDVFRWCHTNTTRIFSYF